MPFTAGTENAMWEIRLSTLSKYGSPTPGGQAENGCFKDAAHAVSLRTGGTDGRFHRLFDGSIQQGEALVPAFQHAHLSGQCGGIVQRKGRIGNAGTAGDVGGDVDAGAVQRIQHDGTACHQRGSDAARKVSTARAS